MEEKRLTSREKINHQIHINCCHRIYLGEANNGSIINTMARPANNLSPKRKCCNQWSHIPGTRSDILIQRYCYLSYVQGHGEMQNDKYSHPHLDFSNKFCWHRPFPFDGNISKITN